MSKNIVFKLADNVSIRYFCVCPRKGMLWLEGITKKQHIFDLLCTDPLLLTLKKTFMRTRLFTLLLSLLCTGIVHAQVFESDGLRFEITSFENHEVSVSSGSGKEQIIIPSKVEYNGEQFTVTGIKDYAFSRSLSSISLPESLTSIGSNAFYGCYSLTLVDVSSENANFSSLDGVLFTKDRSILILYPAGKKSTLYTIPKEVTAIADNAFYSCSSLSSVILPEGLTSIGDNAFEGCFSLSSISLPKSLESIGNVFGGCYALMSIDVASDNPFFSSYDGILFTKDQSSLIRYPAGKQTSSYSVPESVTIIYDGAFNSCSSLTSIVLPDGLTTIGIGAFSACVLLSSIILPDGLTDINHFMFRDCKSLVSVILPCNLKIIGDHVFSGCYNLSSITFPEGLITIGYNAFYNCSSLSSIYSNSVTPPAINDEYTFGGGVDKDIPVYVPQESLEAYKTAFGWSDFTNFQGMTTSVDQPERQGGLIISDGKLHNAEELFLEINDMNGRQVYRGTDTTVSLPSGVYVVRSKSSAFKIAL